MSSQRNLLSKQVSQLRQLLLRPSMSFIPRVEGVDIEGSATDDFLFAVACLVRCYGVLAAICSLPDCPEISVPPIVWT